MSKRESVTSIEQMTMPSRATFEKEFLEGNRPVILTCTMDKGRALKQWTVDFFRNSDVGSRA